MVVRPSAPGVDLLRQSSNPSRSISNRFRSSSVAPVQFMVQTSGSQPPVDEQKPANSPSESTTVSRKNRKLCRSSKAHGNNTRHDVPVPTAAIILSPPPIDTGMFSGKPNSLATRGSRSDWGVLEFNTGKTFRKISHWIDRLQHFPGPLASKNVEEACSRCISCFHAGFTG